VSIRPPDLLDSKPQLRVYQIYPLGKVCVLFACPLILLVLRFACRFKVVLGTARTTQIGGGVTVAKVQRSPCGVVVGQHNVDPPQIELSPTLIERLRANPSGFHHCRSCPPAASSPGVLNGNQTASSFFSARFRSSLQQVRYITVSSRHPLSFPPNPKPSRTLNRRQFGQQQAPVRQLWRNLSFYNLAPKIYIFSHIGPCNLGSSIAFTVFSSVSIRSYCVSFVLA
jgi:hypothetical protein